ncbi:MAG: hypothetical protein MJY69_04345 [Bacteroidales bacterium]|nr:hypothetical protein [Bacteroidales bacterium]
MKKILFVFAVALISGITEIQAQNYDKSKIPPFTLENPLEFVNGKKVKNAKDWQLRRQEILDIFQSEMYGRMPSAPETVVTETLDEGETLAGFAIRRQIRMWFKPDKSGPKIDWLVITPKHVKGPVPVILLLNYGGNHTVLDDEEILRYPNYTRVGLSSYDTGRGSMNKLNSPTIIPVNILIARGYAVVTACYEDISPDPDPGEDVEIAYTRIFDLWGKRDPERTDNTTSLNAWGWGLMRGMDMIERDPQLNEKQVLLTGYSRLGKAALIAGAFDERFPVVVPNQTGGGGAPLAKHYYGENIKTETTSFLHWYCKAYAKYADNEASLNFDQHLFLACVAPRSLMIQGFDEPWYDTESEFMALQAASPVWEMLGKEGLPKVAWPEDYGTEAIGSNLAYVRRNNDHGISAIDWIWMLDFADKNFGRK